jgi:hypothetical protein
MKSNLFFQLDKVEESVIYFDHRYTYALLQMRALTAMRIARRSRYIGSGAIYSSKYIGRTTGRKSREKSERNVNSVMIMSTWRSLLMYT